MLRYMQYKKDKYDHGEDIEKEKLTTFYLNKYKNICIKEIGYTYPSDIACT